MALIIKTGTRVRLKIPSFCGPGAIGTVAESTSGGCVTVMLEGGLMDVMRHEMSVLRDQTPGPEPMRQRLPYGKWICADGREVLFNRDYKPIWQRRPGEAPTAADREEKVRYTGEEHYYGAAAPPWQSGGTLAICEAVLADWGLPAVR